MRVLVTGAAGFIGSNLAIQLVSAGHDVVGIDDFSSAHWSNLIGFRGDVRTISIAHDQAALAAIPPCEVIFHQASITDTTVMDQKQMMDNNVEGFRALLDLSVQWGARMIWASSASTYGRGAAPNKESAQPDPLNVYAYSKLAMEHLADQYRATLRHPLVGLRYFNVYGPGEDHKGKFASMIHQLAKQMRAGQRPRIFTAGEQKRDFVYVDDVVQANTKSLHARRGGIFNIGGGAAYTFNQVVAELNRVLQTNLEPEYFDNPYSFTQDWTQADLTESKRVLGYEPKFDLAKGIDAYFASGKLGV
ncbi:MAG: ADP-glyceromanno-heptose 6-epimerase [Tepidisphaeraceae bacterium]